MKIKTYIFYNLVFCCIVSISSFVFNQGIGMLTQKSTIENAIRDKIEIPLRAIANPSKYIVDVDVLLAKPGDNLSNMKKDTLRVGSKQSSSGSEEDPFSFFLGTNNKGSTSKNPSFKSTTKPDYSKSYSEEYTIKRIDVMIYLEQTLATGSIITKIESIIKERVPMISECTDCIKIETMEFEQSTSDNKLAKIIDRLDLIEAGKTEANTNEEKSNSETKDKYFNELAIRLDDAEAARQDFEKEILSRNRMLDSLRLSHAQTLALESMKNKDSLIISTSNKLDTALKGRIESESDTKDKLIDIIKYQRTGSDSDGGSALDEFSKNMPLVMLIFLAFLVVILLFMSRSKKSDVVYLKPKTKNEEKKTANKKKDKEKDKKLKTDSKDSEEGEENKEKDSSATNPNPPAPINPMPPSTYAFADENVIRSEIQDLRKSAINLTVGQKSGASKLIQEWLEEAPPQDGDEKAGEEGDGE